MELLANRDFFFLEGGGWLLKFVFMILYSCSLSWSRKLAEMFSNKSFVSFDRMKKKYYSWDECLNLREVKVHI